MLPRGMTRGKDTSATVMNGPGGLAVYFAVCPPALFILNPICTIPSIQSIEFVGSGLTQFMKGNVGCIIT